MKTMKMKKKEMASHIRTLEWFVADIMERLDVLEAPKAPEAAPDPKPIEAKKQSIALPVAST